MVKLGDCIPSKTQLEIQIKQGSLLHFSDEHTGGIDPHYHVILNKNPFDDEIILVYCVTFDPINNQHHEKLFDKYDAKTLITTSEGHEKIKRTSLFDCNQCFPIPKNKLINKLEKKELMIYEPVEKELLDKLRRAVINSDMISGNIIDKITEWLN